MIAEINLQERASEMRLFLLYQSYSFSGKLGIGFPINLKNTLKKTDNTIV